jgi:hypothetical protein
MQSRFGIGIVVALVLAATLSAHATAGRRLETQVKRTLSCTTEEKALQITAFATNPTIGSANITISTGNPSVPTGLVGVSNKQPHYGLDSRCHSVAKRVVLNRRGLASAGTVHSGDVRSPTVYCAASQRVLIRLVLSYNASAEPVSATIEILTQPKARHGKQPKSKRIGYIQWSPAKSVTYYSSAACTSQPA